MFMLRNDALRRIASFLSKAHKNSTIFLKRIPTVQGSKYFSTQPHKDDIFAC